MSITVSDRQILVAVIGAMVTILVVVISHEFDQTDRLARMEAAIECLEDDKLKEQDDAD